MADTGILLVDKSAGPSSHDIVQIVRRITGQRRIGHTGTLDPFATGLLPLCLGRATRLAQFVSDWPKSYLARLRFGFATDTQDVTGTPLGDEAPVQFDESTLCEVLRSFEGTQQQVPPQFSAKRVGGKRAYELARAGKKAALDPVSIHVEHIRLLRFQADEAEIDCRVSKGTYIRSLAHDIGVRLGCGAHLTALRRTSVGSYVIERAVGIDALESGSLDWHDAVMSAEEAVASFPLVTLSVELAAQLGRGQTIPWSHLDRAHPPVQAGELVRVFAVDRGLVAMARWPEVGAPLRSEMVWQAVSAPKPVEPASSGSERLR